MREPSLPASRAWSSVCAIALASSVLAVPIAAAPVPAPSRTLVEGRPVRLTVLGRAPVRFAIPVAAGQFARIAVHQQGADVTATLVAPDGARLTSDVADLAHGDEPLSFIAKRAGRYRLTVRARFPEGGPIAVGIDGPRAPTAADRDRLAAEALLRKGDRLRLQGTNESLESAVGVLERALDAARTLGDVRLEVRCALRLGQARTRLSRHADAKAVLASAVDRARTVGDPGLEAATAHALGVALYYLGDLPQAVLRLQEALEVERGCGDGRGEAMTLTTLAAVHGGQGEVRQVITISEQALARKRALGDERGLALTLFNIGVAEHELGHPQRALDRLEEGLRVARRGPDPRDQAPLLAVMGEVYGDLGDSREALRLMNQSLAIWRRSGDRSGEASTIHGIANEQLARGDTDAALAGYEQVRRLRRETDRTGATVAIWQALAYRRRGDGARAAAVLQAALPEIERETVWYYPKALQALGQLARERGDLETAATYQESALERFRALSAPEGAAGSLHELALMDVARGDLARARERLEESLELSESVRRDVSSPDLRASFGANAAVVRATLLDVLTTLHEREPQGGWLARAYATAERARAQSLVEMLSAAHEPSDAAGTTEADLRQRVRSLQDRLAGRLDRQLRLVTGAHTEAEQAQMEAEVQAARADLRAAQARFQVAHAAAPQPPPLEQIQHAVLDPDSLLLEYALGEERSYVFAVTSTSARVHALPGRKTLESLVEPLAAAMASAPGGRASLPPLEPARDASRVLLGPVADDLGERRLVIVPDGILERIPFAALPRPDRDEGLLARHEIVSLPSASLLAALRERAAARPAPGLGAAIFADPVFEATDERVQRAGPGKPVPPRGELSRALGEAGMDRIPRLAFTRREAKGIAALVPASRLWLDDAATLANARTAELARYRFVHFATHGFLNQAHPELSGIVLSLFDHKGRRQRGFLSAAEVFELKLGADLVVLSGCRTAVGRQLEGEGTMGLARGFMYAGASRVVASLWKVDDAATAELMTRFYEGMLRDGLRPAAALRRAQLALAGQKRWALPYYWAGFQLQGDWE